MAHWLLPWGSCCRPNDYQQSRGEAGEPAARPYSVRRYPRPRKGVALPAPGGGGRIDSFGALDRQEARGQVRWQQPRGRLADHDVLDPAAELPERCPRDRDRVHGAPGRRLDAQHVELDRQVVAERGDGRVDASAAYASSSRRVSGGCSACSASATRSKRSVRAALSPCQRGRSQDLGQGAVRPAPSVLKLPEPILGHHEPEAGVGVLLGLGEDVRDAVTVADDLDRLAHWPLRAP